MYFIPAAFGQPDPFRGIEFGRVELRREIFVFADRNLLVVHHPLAVAQDAIDAPVDEQSELGVLKPPARFEVLRRRLVLRLRV